MSRTYKLDRSDRTHHKFAVLTHRALERASRRATVCDTCRGLACDGCLLNQGRL